MIQGGPIVCSGMKWYAGMYSGTQWSKVELGEESYYHLIVQGDSNGDRSSLLQQCVDCGDHILCNNSVFDDGESIVEHPCEKTPFDACYGKGVVGSLGDY